MSDGWYVAQTLTGKERRVRRELRELGYDAVAPIKLMQERRHGAWTTRERIVFPGYVFVRSQMTPEDYYGILAARHVIRLLGKPGAPEPIREDEANLVLWLAGDDAPLGASDILSDGGDATVLSGPLARYAGSIVRLDKRQRRAVIEVNIAGCRQTVSLSINILRSEA